MTPRGARVGVDPRELLGVERVGVGRRVELAERGR